MVARAFFLPGILLLFCAFILSLLVSISLPNLPTLDIVRCHFTGDTVPRVSTDPGSIKEIRVNPCRPSTSTTLLTDSTFPFCVSMEVWYLVREKYVTDPFTDQADAVTWTGRTALMIPGQAIALVSIKVEFINL